jgi:hypothetical protein
VTFTITRNKFALSVLVAVLIGTGIAGAQTDNDNPFTDVPDVGASDEAFFSAPVEWLWDNELTTGTSATTFSPNNGVTRGEYATFNFRYDDKIVQPALAALQAELDAAEAEIDALEAAAPTIYHAWVSTSGTSTVKSDGVTTSSAVTGSYTIVFPEDVSECSWQVSHRNSAGLIIVDPEITNEPEFTMQTRGTIFFPFESFPTDINVFVTDQAGSPAKASFSITVICP